MKSNRHERKLIPSRADVVVLGYEVEYRFLKLCDLYLKKTNVQLAIPVDIHDDFLLYRHMRVRHKCLCCGGPHLARVVGAEQTLLDRKSHLPYCAECGGTGDYRHRESEIKALNVVARWTLKVKAELSDQPVPEWEGVVG